MPKIHIRDHDGSRVRIWTDEMRPYGQFNVIPLGEAENLHTVITRHDLGFATIVHRCDTDDECKCSALTFGETIKSQI